MALIPLARLVRGATSAFKKGAPLSTDFIGLQKGGTVNDLTNGVLYVNTGTNTAPTYTTVGSQT